MSVEAVLRGETLPTKEFCDVLISEVKNGHARLHHPFYLALYDGKLSLDEIQVWAKEAWGIFAYNVAINTAKLVRCQLSGIHDPQIHKKFVEIIQSEVGYQYFEGTPRRVPGHRALFLRFGESIGIPASELERCERENDFLPMTMLARAGWLDIALRSDSILEQVASTNCCNEFSNQLTGGWFFRAFKNHYGLKEHDIEFFAEHGEADTEHSNIGYELVEQFAATNEIQVKVLRALQKGLSIWWAITDGVVRECERRKKLEPVLQYSITPTRNCMDLLSTYHLKQWVEANKDYFNPPFRTNRLLVHHKDFLVMILRGPNTRLDFHIEPGDEFFYQVEGAMELHLKAPGERRQVVEIKEGEIFVCPGGLAHSPRRFENTWGLVIERKRRPGEKEEFAWFCEKCDEAVLSRVMDPDNIPAQVSRVYQEFNGSEKLRTCRACGYVFPETPMAERLGFLETKK